MPPSVIASMPAIDDKSQSHSVTTLQFAAWASAWFGPAADAFRQCTPRCEPGTSLSAGTDEILAFIPRDAGGAGCFETSLSRDGGNMSEAPARLIQI
ncbi:hypothetical protein DENSPDRAFT_79999 [Dentipellis sp. KUC8613]|nr:hypothetical protein DENSPDRAFT_79999 [Dentipellis sp. KUC8613]